MTARPVPRVTTYGNLGDSGGEPDRNPQERVPDRSGRQAPRVANGIDQEERRQAADHA